MKFLVISLLAIFAVNYVRSDTDGCSEERAEVCVQGLLDAMLSGSSEKQKCKELRSSIDCLREAVEECLEEDDEEVEDGLQELEKLFSDSCNSDDSNEVDLNGIDDEEKEEIEKCFSENEDYIFECIPSEAAETLSALQDQDLEEDALKCAMYAMVTGCFVDRLKEKCGETPAKIAEKEFADKPLEIEEACKAAGEMEVHSFNLLDAKRKK